jgi:hypothetical protein
MTTAEWVDPQSLPPGSMLDIETRNRRYQVECLGGSRIRICGHPDLCPTPSSATLQGSADKAGVSEPLISPGRYLQFVLQDRHITTTRVMKVRVQLAPAASSSVH